MKGCAWLLAPLCAACVIPPLEVSGKLCTDGCPEGFTCQSRVCVPAGAGLCDVLHATSCLDFEHGVSNWTNEVPPGFGAFRITADGGTPGAGLEVATPSLDGGTPGRLDLALQPWQHAKLSFDFFPELAAPPDDVSIAEIQCASSYQGAWLHYVHGANAFALQSGPTGDPSVALAPPPAMGAWSHIVLEATPGHATVSVDGQHAADVSFDLCPMGQWQVTLGLITNDTTEHHARFDNVVVETTPP